MPDVDVDRRRGCCMYNRACGIYNLQEPEKGERLRKPLRKLLRVYGLPGIG